MDKRAKGQIGKKKGQRGKRAKGKKDKRMFEIYLICDIYV